MLNRNMPHTLLISSSLIISFIFVRLIDSDPFMLIFLLIIINPVLLILTVFLMNLLKVKSKSKRIEAETDLPLTSSAVITAFLMPTIFQVIPLDDYITKLISLSIGTVILFIAIFYIEIKLLNIFIH